MGKDSFQIELNGAVDETQAAIGLVRAHSNVEELNAVCLRLETDLWVLMAEVGTLKENRAKLSPGKTLVSLDMIDWIEHKVDEISSLFDMPREFVLPGNNLVSAYLDLARVTARRAERVAIAFVNAIEETNVGKYLNRLSDLLWVLARWQEGEHLRTRTMLGKE